MRARAGPRATHTHAGALNRPPALLRHRSGSLRCKRGRNAGDSCCPSAVKDPKESAVPATPAVPDADPAPSATPAPPPDPPLIEPREQRPFMAVLAQKLIDTGDDIALHATRFVQGHDAEAAATSNFVSDGSGCKVYRSSKPIALVLGFGWAAHSFAKVVDVDKFDVVVVSPRNHFLFTPMLPSTAVGSVEFRSLLEPVRSSNPFATYLEASAEHVDLQRKVATCRSVTHGDGPGLTPVSFQVPYACLLVAVGETPATFGVPGVLEHCFFLKEVTDSVRIRKRLSQQFEAAGFLGSEEERRAALRCVIVGGGPTGVEFAGTLSDFIFREVAALYPKLIEFTEVVLVQSGSSILQVFERALATRAAANLEEQRVRIVTNARVTNVGAHALTLLMDGQESEMPYGLCIWSTGNSSRELTAGLVEQLPAQQPFRQPRRGAQKLAVDDYLRIIGAEGAFAAGDCSFVLRGPLPPNAQVAGQQGAYIARAVNRNPVLGVGGVWDEPPFRTVEAAKAKEHEHPFDFLSLGIMAYVGRSQAIMQLDMDVDVSIWGRFAFLLWRSVYITKQVSMRNRVLILFDWLKTRVFGRDISLF